MYRKQLIAILVLLAWMLIIFYMSHQPGDDSSGMSRKVCRVICEVFVEDFEGLAPSEQERLIDGMEFWVRKSAHCLEYMALGILMYLNIALYAEGRKTVPQMKAAAFGRKRRGLRKLFWTSLAAGVLYAISDEIHQYFIPGRSCELRDVCIDSLGVLIGVTATMVLAQRRKNRK